MSFTDPAAEVAQPTGGQGDGGAGNPAYAEYLSRIPEDARGAAEEAFRAWDANYQRTTQEHSEYRKGWEPYEQAGVNQYPAETVAWALQVLQNPQEARTWLDQQYGPVAAAAEAQQPEADPYGFQDPSQQQFEKLLEEKLTPLQQFMEQQQSRWEQLEQTAREEQIADALNAEITALKAAEAANLPEHVRENFESYIEKFAMPYAEPGANPHDVVSKGWSELQQFVNELEKGVLQAKVDAPKPAETGGMPDVSAPQAKRIADVRNEAVEFLRNNNRA